MRFSVLMSVYGRERAEFLTASLDSVIDQTVVPDEIVVVKDGPLTPELDAVLNDYAARHETIRLVEISKNVGLGCALNEGLKHCTYEIVARMDSDDISCPDRFEKQLAVLRDNPDVAVVGTWIDEFVDRVDNVVAVRCPPKDGASLLSYAKKRNPLNHVTAAFRKSAVLEAGGYRHFPLFEDYYLWVRMLTWDKRFFNIPESLVLVRVSSEMYKRRGGTKYLSDEWRLQREFHKIGFISRAEMVVNMATRTIFRLIPNGMRAFLYKNFLRRT